MIEYLIKLRPKSSFEIIPSSDTLFGAICWAIRTLYGESGDNGLNNLLERFVKRESLPFLVSSTFPCFVQYDETEIYYFPKPELPPLSKNKLQEIATKYQDKWKLEFDKPHYSENIFFIKTVSEYKRFRKISWIPHSQFEGILKERGEKDLFIEFLDNRQDSPHIESIAVQKNKLDRFSNSTTGEGQTFYNNEIYFGKGIGLYFLFKTQEINWFEPVFKYLSDSGIGSNKRMGKNHFWIDPFITSPFNFNIENANGFVSLSRFISNPAKDEIDFETDALYQIKPVRSKVESREEFMGEDIWKNLTMTLLEGSIFKTKERAKIYGDIVEVKELKGKKIYQYGLCYPVWGKLDFGDER
ncbi:type III-A CRISPR-associated RAMP protein Csm4 [Candidatus Kuenenia sp.]|uniref:type III-A CRISPR-associated RAMP protein Csm4 n=1 Tax=Candidatus Kuenenia sp. TaxID=2499824 RepID=UPI00321FEE71